MNAGMNENAKRIRDVASLKAVAHPLRVRLLGALRVDGPATASSLARRFGESSGATSYHLRQLARYGFVEEDPEQPNARDRRWRAAHRYTSVVESDVAGDPTGPEAVRWLRRHQQERLAYLAERFEEEPGWSAAWRDAAGYSDDIVRLTPESVAELHDRFVFLMREYAARDAQAPGTEQVAVFLSAFPVTRDAL